MAKITIHGYSESFLINWSVNVYNSKSSVLLGKVSCNSSISIDAEEGDTLYFKSKFRKTSLVVAKDVTDVFLQIDRFNGALNAFGTNKENLLMTKQFVDGKSSHAKLKVYLLFLIIILIILLLVLFSK